MATSGSANQLLGSAFVTDANGDYITDANGDYIVVADPGSVAQLATGGSANNAGVADQTLGLITQTAVMDAPHTGVANQQLGVIAQATSGSFSGGRAAQTLLAFDQIAEGIGPGFQLPEDVTSPVISGRPSVGGLLTVTNGTWGSLVVLEYRYQWRVAGANVADGITQTFIPPPGSDWQLVACLVRAVTADATFEQLSNEVLVRPSGGGDDDARKLRKRQRKIDRERDEFERLQWEQAEALRATIENAFRETERMEQERIAQEAETARLVQEAKAEGERAEREQRQLLKTRVKRNREAFEARLKTRIDQSWPF